VGRDMVAEILWRGTERSVRDGMNVDVADLHDFPEFGRRSRCSCG
jgi:hypothetical protein